MIHRYKVFCVDSVQKNLKRYARSQVIVNRKKGLARFVFMHCMASALCFWVNAITRETMDSLVNKTYFHESVCENDPLDLDPSDDEG